MATRQTRNVCYCGLYFSSFVFFLQLCSLVVQISRICASVCPCANIIILFLLFLFIACLLFLFLFRLFSQRIKSHSRHSKWKRDDGDNKKIGYDFNIQYFSYLNFCDLPNRIGTQSLSLSVWLCHFWYRRYGAVYSTMNFVIYLKPTKNLIDEKQSIHLLVARLQQRRSRKKNTTLNGWIYVLYTFVCWFGARLQFLTHVHCKLVLCKNAHKLNVWQFYWTRINWHRLHYYYLYFAALKTAEKPRKMAMFGIDWMLIQLNDVFTCQILAHTIC